MRSIRRRALAVLVATGAVALAAPVPGGSAQAQPIGLPGGFDVVIGGNQIGAAGCVGTNRPAFGGNNASTSAIGCGGATYEGAQFGSLNSSIGPSTVINSAFSEVNVSAGSITG
jgi:hypothetical protein